MEAPFTIDQCEEELATDVDESAAREVLNDRQKEKWHKIFAQRRRHWAPPH